jgi:hypothetical protein
MIRRAPAGRSAGAAPSKLRTPAKLYGRDSLPCRMKISQRKEKSTEARKRNTCSGKITGGLDRRSQHPAAGLMQPMENKSNPFKTAGYETEKSKCGNDNEIEESSDL